MPIVVSNGNGVIVGPPLPVVVVSGSLSSDPTLSTPSFVRTNTTFTNDMGPDGYNWSQGGRRGPIEVDQYGKLIALAEYVNGDHTISYSNDLGATWNDGPTLQFLTRGALAYSSADDRLHVLWVASDPADGVLFRRYTPTRDGSNNITAWAATDASYTQFDAQVTGTMEYKHPMILWLNDAAYGAHGALVCAWCCRNTGVGGTGNEIRAVMRQLSNSAADIVLANWTDIGVNSASTIGNAPLTASYTALLANATTGIPHAALNRLADNNLFVAYHTGTVTGGKMAGAWNYRRATWAAGSNNWTALQTAQAICNMVRAGADSGYASKGELVSKIVQDAAGNVGVGIATWKSNAAGDTWGWALISLADAVTLIDTYSASGVHSYAPTGDLEYDSIADRYIASYVTTIDQFAYLTLYNSTTPTQADLLAFNSAPVDIPLTRSRAVPNKLAMLFRDTATPHLGWFGTLAWN